MIEHQPGHDASKQLRGKGHLEHRLVMGTYFDIVPAPQGHRKSLGYPCAQALGFQAGRCRIIVDMGMIACDLGDGSRGGTVRQRASDKCRRDWCPMMVIATAVPPPPPRDGIFR